MENNLKDTISALKLSPHELELFGGKNISISEEFLQKGIIIPPNLPPSDNFGGDDSNKNNLPELRSSEVNEVLNQPPNWLVSWGITIFFGIILLLIGVTWFVRYPDLVKGNIKIIANNFPKSVVTKIDGKLIKLLVDDAQNVNQGQYIAFLESTAKYEEVLALDSITNTLVALAQADSLSNVYQSMIQTYFQLGELQKKKPYQSFQESFVKVKSLINNGMYLQKRKILQNDLNTLISLKGSLENQQENTKQDYSLAEEEFERQKDLLRQKIISKNDYNVLITKLLSKKQSLEQMNSNLKSQDMSQNQKRAEILELDKTIAEQKNAFIQSLYALKSDIEAWKQRYIAIAPTTGKVTFLQTLQENQTVKNGQELLYIMPKGEGFHGEMAIGQFNFGKIKIGQEIIIKLQSHPFEEFGTINGRIQNISEIPKDSSYFVKVSFPKGLTTSANKTINFRNGMAGTGEIITDNKRLIERFLREFMRVFER